MNRSTAQESRRRRIRRRIRGSAERPRLVVTLSLQRTSAQIIDDTAGRTIVGLADQGEGTKTDRARRLGAALAAKAKEQKVKSVVFDRAGHPYRGRTRAVAEGAREGGLEL